DRHRADRATSPWQFGTLPLLFSPPSKNWLTVIRGHPRTAADKTTDECPRVSSNVHWPARRKRRRDMPDPRPKRRVASASVEPAPADRLAAAYWTRIGKLSKWERNPRRNADAVPRVARSIRQYGFVAPVVVWRSRRRLVAGHTRIAALELILAKEPGFVPRDAPGVGLVPVRFHEFTDEAEAAAYAIADNKLTELAEWDEQKLGEIFAEIKLADETLLAETGFAAGDIEQFIREASGPDLVGEDPGPSEPPLHPVSRPGEIYELGPHLLMCGDSTNATDVARLMNGETAALLSTDPPYCVDYTGMDRPIHDGKPSGKDWSHV